jgi:hypothetical protein
MTIPEIAAQLRMVLGVCAKADENVSPAERIYFAAAQNDSSDEEISLLLAFPLRLSLLGIFLTSAQEILALLNNYDSYDSCGCSA